MKMITKFCKIFLVLAIIISQLSSTITVLADELDILEKPLVLELKQIFDEDNDCIDSYELNYQSQNSDYEETEIIDEVEVDKTYDIVLTSTFTYLNNEVTLEKVETIEDVTGKTLNDSVSTYSLDPISKYYNGEFKLNVTVKDDDSSVIYDEDLFYVVDNAYVGLIGSLNMGDVLPISETIGNVSEGKYEITEDGSYIQHLILMPGELSPNGSYKIVMSDGTRSEVKTGIEIFEMIFEGVSISFDGKLSGDYAYNNNVTIEEVLNEEVINTYSYTYNTNIEYTNDDEKLLNDLFEELLFEGEYVIVNAKNLFDDKEVITIGEILEVLDNTGIEIEVFDETGEQLDLENEDILISQIKNDYTLKFISGNSKTYKVVVRGDITSDNMFDSEDMIPTMDKYLEEENSLSMDILNEDNEEFGTITFKDIMYINELLKEEGDVSKEEFDNENLSLVLSDVSEKVYVGDTFELSLSVDSDNLEDYIDGIDALVATNDNLKLVDIKFNDSLIGTYNEDGRFVASGLPLLNEDIIMTLTFAAATAGVGTIEISGDISKYLNIKEFDSISKEIEIISNISSNNKLDSLKPSVGTFDTDFDSDTNVYTLYVPYDTESVILSGSLADISAKVDGLIEYKLSADKTTAIITVTAEDGSTRVYTVYIIKESKPTIEENSFDTIPVTYYYSSNNYLKLLEIDGYEIEFDKEIGKYEIDVKNDVISLDIKALAEDVKARVEITGNEKFKEGENTVVITVTAEDGSTREYKIVVNKEEKKDTPVEIEDSSNTAEKVVIIVLIILVVLGLLYLIFKKDEEEVVDTVKNNNSSKKNNSKK